MAQYACFLLLPGCTTTRPLPFLRKLGAATLLIFVVELVNCRIYAAAGKGQLCNVTSFLSFGGSGRPGRTTVFLSDFLGVYHCLHSTLNHGTKSTDYDNHVCNLIIVCHTHQRPSVRLPSLERRISNSKSQVRTSILL